MVLHDFVYPRRRLVRGAWITYLGALRLLGPRLFPEWRTVFLELPAFLRESSWVDDLRHGLAMQGLAEIEVELLGAGTAAIVTAEGVPGEDASA